MLIKKENDHPDFILNCEKIIKNKINLWKPVDIFVTRINNWFDEKWMGYSGNSFPGVSIWKGNITVPPFNPNRVELSDFYQKTNGRYIKKEHAKALHIYQNSIDNLKRFITDFTTNGLFVWYSGNSKANEIGTLMCYLVREAECQPFFITLSQKKGWNVSETNGILINEIQIILENSLA